MLWIDRNGCLQVRTSLGVVTLLAFDQTVEIECVEIVWASLKQNLRERRGSGVVSGKSQDFEVEQVGGFVVWVRGNGGTQSGQCLFEAVPLYEDSSESVRQAHPVGMSCNTLPCTADRIFKKACPVVCDDQVKREILGYGSCAQHVCRSYKLPSFDTPFCEPVERERKCGIGLEGELPLAHRVGCLTHVVLDYAQCKVRLGKGRVQGDGALESRQCGLSLALRVEANGQ